MGIYADKYRTRIENVNPDGTLKEEDGWKFAMRWLVDEKSMDSKLGALGYAVFPPGTGRHELHVHDDAEEIAIYLKGHGMRTVGDEQYEVGPGTVAFVPVGVPHGMRNLSETEPIELFCIYCGAGTVEKTGYRMVNPQEGKLK